MEKKDLLELIKKADKAYYDKDEPFMSDSDYDALRFEYIKKYGKDDLDYVPGNISSQFKSYKHNININSLDKVKYNETEKLSSEIKRLLPVVAEYKIDGLTIVSYPNGDGSSLFVTRGNGSNGEVLPAFNSAFTTSNNSKYPIRGEAYLLKSDFDNINKEREQQGLKKYLNIRNAASGILRRLDKNNPYINKIQYLCYDVLGYDVSEERKLKYISDNTNFDVVEYTKINDEKEAESVIPQLYNEGLNSDIPIDGIAVKSNIDESLKLFGSTEHHPLNAFAWKAEQEQVTTTLKEIVWQVGRESITPVAVFDTVSIDGTSVDRASLHNWNNIVALDLKINDDILVEKRNQIIPHVIKVIKHNYNSINIAKPTVCPVCGTELNTRILKKTNNKINNLSNDEIEFYCPNDDCSGKLSNKINFVFSKKCLNAKGLSIKTIDKLIESKKVNSITDMFELTVDDFLALEGFKEKSAKANYEAIQSARTNIPFDKFIPSCGIMSIGFDVGKTLAKKYTYDSLLDVLKNRRIDELKELKNIGDVLAKKLISKEFIDAYIDLNNFVSIAYPKDLSSSVAVSGSSRSFVITGSLSKPRSYFVDLIEKHGDIVVGSVSKNTYALLTDDKNSTSSKAQKARSLNIKIMDEESLDELYSDLKN